MAKRPRQTLHGFIMREAAVCSRMKPRPMPERYCSYCDEYRRDIRCEKCGHTTYTMKEQNP